MKTLADYEYYRTDLGVLYCGDCLEILPLIPDNSVDLVLTDYPYGEVNRNDNGLRNLDKGDADIINLSLEHITQTLINKTNGNFVSWCGHLQLSPIFQLLYENKLSQRLLVWEKTNPSPMNGEKVYVSGIEKACYGKKPNAVFNGFCKNTIFRYPIEHGEHPTPKSTPLFIEILQDLTNINQLVLDSFIGGGTTALACEKLSRRWIGIEISEKYCEIAKKRISQEANQLKLFTEVSK